MLWDAIRGLDGSTVALLVSVIGLGYGWRWAVRLRLLSLVASLVRRG